MKAAAIRTGEKVALVVEVGRVSIFFLPEHRDKVFLKHVDGEAGSFPLAKLEAALEAFFWKEF